MANFDSSAQARPIPKLVYLKRPRKLPIMKNRNILLVLALIVSSTSIHAQKSKTYTLASPDGNTSVRIEAGAKLKWSVTHNGQPVIAPSSMSLQLQDGTALGDNAKISSAPVRKINTTFQTRWESTWWWHGEKGIRGLLAP